MKIWKFIFCFLFLFPLSTAINDNCENDQLLSKEEKDWLCKEVREWSKMDPFRDGHQTTFTPNQSAYLKSLQSSGQKRNKRQTKFRAVRKEYRVLNEKERRRLHYVMNAMKEQKVDGVSKWDLLTSLHYPETAPGAHFGPAFLPWHREFLRQVEVALRKIDPDTAIPYWDTSLDSELPNPRDSMLWTDRLLGNGNGHVVTGPFAYWPTPISLPRLPHIRSLYRNLGVKGSRLMNGNDTKWLMSRTSFDQLTFCKDKRFEMMHGMLHLWVGGFMHVIRLSPNDPVFYFLHSYVDYMWEKFRRERQNKIRREHEYLSVVLIKNCAFNCKSHILQAFEMCKRTHALHAKMSPFENLMNQDGLSDEYTKKWYRYENSPTCTKHWPSCNSPYLFCDRNGYKCRAKIQPGGNCSGFEHTYICYNSSCVDGICAGNLNHQKLEQVKEIQTNTGIWLKILVLGKNGEPVTNRRTKIIVRGENYEGLEITHPLSKFKYPEFPGIAYAKTVQPRNRGITRASVLVFDQFGRICQAFCGQNATYLPCNSSVVISEDRLMSHPIAYTHSRLGMRFLNTDLRGHPTEWRVKSPYLTFMCDFETRTELIENAVDTVKPDFSESKYIWFPITVLKISSKGHQEKSKVKITVSDGIFETIDQKEFYYNYPETVFIWTKNPFNSTFVKTIITVRSDGKYCKPECFSSVGSVIHCTNQITLSNHVIQSHWLAFTADKSMTKFIGWKLTGHPKLWKPDIASINFLC